MPKTHTSRLDNENEPCAASSRQAMLNAFSQLMVTFESISVLVGIAWERTPIKRNAVGDSSVGTRSRECSRQHNGKEETRLYHRFLSCSP